MLGCHTEGISCIFFHEKSPTFNSHLAEFETLMKEREKMIARLVNDDDVKLPHGFHETKVTKKED